MERQAALTDTATRRYMIDIDAIESLKTLEPQTIIVHVNASPELLPGKGNRPAACGYVIRRPSCFGDLNWALTVHHYEVCPKCFSGEDE